jgi:CHAD domain-containing protein
MLLSAKAVSSVNADRSGAPDQPVESGLGTLLGALGVGYRASVGAVHRSEFVHLDSADWRLLRAGMSATYRPRGGLLVASFEGARAEQSIAGQRWPALLNALPDGPAVAMLGPQVGVRALMPVARTRAAGRIITVRNSDDKIVARVQWRQIIVLEPRLASNTPDAPETPALTASAEAGDTGGELPGRVEVRPLRGYDRDAHRIRQLLADAGIREVSERDEFADLVARAELGPASPPQPIRPGDRADVAVARVLLRALDDIEAAAPGVLADIDTEFLHDLRVDVRRTRSLLKRLGDVLPDGAVERFGPEFKWLGAASTPTRDLDVYLLGIDDLAAMVPHPEDLGPFVEYLENRRDVERRALARALRSDRFQLLCTQWRALLTDVVDRGAGSGRSGGARRTGVRRTVAALADERLGAVYDAVARKASRMDAATPAEKVHDLRKAAKDLRYLLEAFHPLADPERHRLVLKDLKRMQDVLGEFQDGEFQAASLRTYAQEMIDLGETRAQAILAMGELAGRFGAVQLAARSELDAHHAEYLGPATRRRLHRLVAT